MPTKKQFLFEIRGWWFAGKLSPDPGYTGGGLEAFFFVLEAEREAESGALSALTPSQSIHDSACEGVGRPVQPAAAISGTTQNEQRHSQPRVAFRAVES